MSTNKGAAKGETESSPEASEATRRVLPDTAGADALVRKWALWAAGFGIVPIPLLDFAATTGFSMKLVHSLAKYYGVEFRAEAGRVAISSLLGGAASPMLAMASTSVVKGIPLIGIPLAVATGPIFAGGITYGIGRVFTAHFGSGGTLFDFDPEAFRDYFQQQVEAGKEFVAERKPGKADAKDAQSAKSTKSAKPTAKPKATSTSTTA